MHTPDDLLAAYNERSASGDGCPLSIDNASYLPALQLAYGKLNPNKATTDQVPPCAVAAAPDQFARLHHPLLFKMGALVREPLRLKGTLAHPLRKAAPPTATMLDFRSISIRSLVTKTCHAFPAH